MAKRKLFQNAKEIIKGYDLTTKKTHRKVYLVGRPLKSGNVSLIRYHSSGSGKFRIRQREATGVILCIETDFTIKLENEEKVRMQHVVCDTINANLEREGADFKPIAKQKTILTDYIEELGERALNETGNRHSIYSTMQSLSKHVNRFRKNTILCDVDKKWCLLFIDYLKHKALNLNYQRSKCIEKRREKPLSQNSQNRIIRSLNYVMNWAVRESLIPRNPMYELDARDKVPAKQGNRNYLTKKEIDKLIHTPFTHGRHDIKEAFLFSCYTGLRYGDLMTITMSDIYVNENGRYLDITMIKTKQHLKVYVPLVAMKLIPRTSDFTKPLFHLPKNEYANVLLAQWIKDSGISKKITFHCARHSTATLLLSSGIPIAVVAKQLGHLKIQTTEIYANIIDEAQIGAAHKIDELFE